MTSVRLTLRNTTTQPLSCVKVGGQRLEAGMEMQPFNQITLGAEQTQTVNIYIDFGGKTQPASFDLSTDKGTYPVTLPPPAGELVVPLRMDSEVWGRLAGGLKGMHEHKLTLDRAPEGG
eukprot:CAMPEP_0169443042 /NCGR_PEP_ID=MMETSP1042-20121227/9146_1 /TAXON_ID=464988 /ORGANISM="Hemiselmis andersenii, Strain CCMP1180" /LENGTH=118 /DNA_ID=CAMNT_0009554247 /DNA_START=152 /DNA_END=504 /DNA_ORIENTATION=+